MRLYFLVLSFILHFPPPSVGGGPRRVNASESSVPSFWAEGAGRDRGERLRREAQVMEEVMGTSATCHPNKGSGGLSKVYSLIGEEEAASLGIFDIPSMPVLQVSGGESNMHTGKTGWRVETEKSVKEVDGLKQRPILTAPDPVPLLFTHM